MNLFNHTLTFVNGFWVVFCRFISKSFVLENGNLQQVDFTTDGLLFIQEAAMLVKLYATSGLPLSDSSMNRAQNCNYTTKTFDSRPSQFLKTNQFL